MKPLFAMALALLILCGVCGCSGTESPTQSQQGLVGNLNGEIELHGVRGELLTDMSGVKVVVEGTSFSALTDARGKWKIKDLPAGTYILVYSKAGIGTTKRFGYQFVGGGEAYAQPVRLSEAPIFGITDLTLSSIKVDTANRYTPRTATFAGKISPSVLQLAGQTIWFQIGSTAEIAMDWERSSRGTYGQIPDGSKDFSITIDAGYLYNNGFKTGDTIYVAAYGGSGYPQVVDCYYDPILDVNIFPNHGSSSNAVKIVLP